jgi:hypothetical protein
MMPSQANSVALDTVRVWPLGGFRVSVGSRTISEGRWRSSSPSKTHGSLKSHQGCEPWALSTTSVGSRGNSPNKVRASSFVGGRSVPLCAGPLTSTSAQQPGIAMTSLASLALAEISGLKPDAEVNVFGLPQKARRLGRQVQVVGRDPSSQPVLPSPYREVTRCALPVERTEEPAWLLSVMFVWRYH